MANRRKDGPTSGRIIFNPLLVPRRPMRDLKRESSLTLLGRRLLREFPHLIAQARILRDRGVPTEEIVAILEEQVATQ